MSLLLWNVVVQQDIMARYMMNVIDREGMVVDTIVVVLLLRRSLCLWGRLIVVSIFSFRNIIISGHEDVL